VTDELRNKKAMACSVGRQVAFAEVWESRLNEGLHNASVTRSYLVLRGFVFKITFTILGSLVL
jgi:hypothetical protein